MSPRLIHELYRIFLEIPSEFRQKEEAVGYKAKDGHVTSPYAERFVDNWLKEHLPYKHLYSYSQDIGGHLIRSDWYIPEIELYIEFQEGSRPAYDDSTDIKHMIYRNHSLKVVDVYEDDLASLDRMMPPKISALVPKWRPQKLAERRRRTLRSGITRKSMR